jgi:hypothetical protein
VVVELLVAATLSPVASPPLLKNAFRHPTEPIGCWIWHDYMTCQISPRRESAALSNLGATLRVRTVKYPSQLPTRVLSPGQKLSLNRVVCRTTRTQVICRYKFGGMKVTKRGAYWIA